MKRLFFCVAVIWCVSGAEAVVWRDVEFSNISGKSLKLDLFVPSDQELPALVVYVHGGAWRSGSKENPPVMNLVDRGFALASVEYRLSTEEKFPAQIFDIKASIRFLRAHAGDYGFDPDRIIIMGSSAGGHLAALVGVTNGHPCLEGERSEGERVSSDVQGIVSFYGASNLETILAQSTPHGLNVRVPALQLLLGGQPDEVPELARLASPVQHVDSKDPPLLLIHGDQDIQMPVNQSLELLGQYESKGLKATFLVVNGGGHGGKEFYDPLRLDKVESFIRMLRR